MASHTLVVTVKALDIDEVRAVVEAAMALQECMPWMGNTWPERVERLAALEGPVMVSGPGLAALFHALSLLAEHSHEHVLNGTDCWCGPRVESVPPA